MAAFAPYVHIIVNIDRNKTNSLHTNITYNAIAKHKISFLSKSFFYNIDI